MLYNSFCCLVFRDLIWKITFEFLDWFMKYIVFDFGPNLFELSLFLWFGMSNLKSWPKMDQRFWKNAGGSLILGHNKRGYYRKCFSITNYFNFQIFISSRTIELMPWGYFHKPLIKNLLCTWVTLHTLTTYCIQKLAE